MLADLIDLTYESYNQDRPADEVAALVTAKWHPDTRCYVDEQQVLILCDETGTDWLDKDLPFFKILSAKLQSKRTESRTTTNTTEITRYDYPH